MKTLIIITLCLIGFFAFPAETNAAVVYGKTRSVVELELKGCAVDKTPTVNLFGIPLYREILFRGQLQNATGRELLFKKGQLVEENFDLNTSQYYVEIVTGPNRGQFSDIENLSETSMILTTASDLSSILQGSEKIRIGRHHTLFSFFGVDNRYGLKSGKTQNEADELIIFDARNQVPEIYFFSTVMAGWVKASAPRILSGDVIIYPGQGLFLRRKELAGIKIAVSGPLVVDSFNLPVEPGINIMSDLQQGTHKQSNYIERARARVVSSRTNPQPIMLAGDVGALTTAPDEAGNIRFVPDISRSWINAVGLRPNERVNVVAESAFILKEPTNILPYFLSSDEN